MKTLRQIQKAVHKLAKAKGWYDPPKTDVEAIMMVVTELAEAVEEIRKEQPADIYYNWLVATNVFSNEKKGLQPKPEGLAIELADAVIRILDFCEYKGIDLQEAIELKHAYNKTRSRRHGGKKV